jgi:hypothetical protein
MGTGSLDATNAWRRGIDPWTAKTKEDKAE